MQLRIDGMLEPESEAYAPRRYTMPEEHRSEDDLYFTPPWMIRLALSRWKPALPDRVLDPCAADGRLGKAFHAQWLIDLTPRADEVKPCDFLTLKRHDFGGEDISVVLNPPFDLAQEFILHALTLAGKTGDVLALTRTGIYQQVGWKVSPCHSILPKHRVAFQCTADRARYLEEKAKRKGKLPTHRFVGISSDCPTGWELGSPGDDHGWFQFRNGHTGFGTVDYVIVTPFLSDDSKQIKLF